MTIEPAELLAHPLATRYLAKAKNGDNEVYSAADVLGERIARVATMVMLARHDAALLRTNTETGQQLAAVEDFARDALEAVPYLWTEEVRGAMAASVGAGFPRHVISPRLLPAAKMWWTFETAVTIAEIASHGVEMAVDGMMLCDSVDRFMVFLFGELEDPEWETADLLDRRRPFIEAHQFRYGTVYPDDFAESPSRTIMETVLTYMAFLNSPYIPKVQQRLTRYERRDVARHAAPDVGEEISFVMLRRPEPAGKNDKAEGTIDWKHRWIVSGHYRAQWYPTEQAHHVIWIAPHLKGPVDAPLLEHAYKVIR